MVFPTFQQKLKSEQHYPRPQGHDEVSPICAHIFHMNGGCLLSRRSQELHGTSGRINFILILYQEAFWEWQCNSGHRQEYLPHLKPLPCDFLMTFAKSFLFFTALFPLLNFSQHYPLVMSLSGCFVSAICSMLDISLCGDPQEQQKYRQAADDCIAPTGSLFFSSCHHKMVAWFKGL